MKFLEILLCSYPLYATFCSIKKPRNATLRHWLIYWTLFLNLELVEYVTWGYFPFMGMIKISVLLPNWSPYVTDMSFNTLNMWIKTADQYAKKHEYWSYIRPTILNCFCQIDELSTNWWNLHTVIYKNI